MSLTTLCDCGGGCGDSDFAYPMRADVYYSTVEQGDYGSIKKQWMKAKTISCHFASGGIKNKQEQQPQNVAITFDTILNGRTSSDIRFSDLGSGTSLTNILITNIVDGEGNSLYLETGGIRAGKSTLFEIATLNPSSGLFGKTEYYKLIIKRSDNQAVDL